MASQVEEGSWLILDGSLLRMRGFADDSTLVEQPGCFPFDLSPAILFLLDVFGEKNFGDS